MQTAAKSAGCFKCGKSGHWSRDCTVPQSGWIRQQPASEPGGVQQPGGTVAGEAQLGKSSPAELPPPVRKRKPKPKLTFDVLQDSKLGLPAVYQSFADDFKKKCKGRGHEAGDLKRLLDMYRRWQHALFPSLQFDDFLEGVEKIGRTNQVKEEMRHLRRYALQPLEEKDGNSVPSPSASGAPIGTPQVVASGAAFSVQAANAEGDGVDEDDYELVEPDNVEQGMEVGQQQGLEEDVMDELIDNFDP